MDGWSMEAMSSSSCSNCSCGVLLQQGVCPIGACLCVSVCVSLFRWCLELRIKGAKHGRKFVL